MGTICRLEIDPARYSEKARRLIARTAERRKCTPAEAIVFLLNKVASQTSKIA